MVRGVGICLVTGRTKPCGQRQPCADRGCLTKRLGFAAPRDAQPVHAQAVQVGKVRGIQRSADGQIGRVGGFQLVCHGRIQARSRQRPGLEQPIDSRQLCRARGGCRECQHLIGQSCSLRGARAHRLSQITQCAAAAHVGQRARRGTQRNGVCEIAVEGVVGEIEVACLHQHAVDLRGAAVGSCNAGRASHGVAVAQVAAAGRDVQRDGRDAGLGQALQFACLTQAVTVQVAPDL